MEKKLAASTAESSTVTRPKKKTLASSRSMPAYKENSRSLSNKDKGRKRTRPVIPTHSRGVKPPTAKIMFVPPRIDFIQVPAALRLL